MKYRYSAWDGTQQPFPLDADTVLEAISDDLMWTYYTLLSFRPLAEIDEELNQLALEIIELLQAVER